MSVNILSFVIFFNLLVRFYASSTHQTQTLTTLLHSRTTPLTGSTSSAFPLRYCDYISSYFSTARVAVRRAGPFWYRYRIPFELTSLYYCLHLLFRATRVLFCDQHCSKFMLFTTKTSFPTLHFLPAVFALIKAYPRISPTPLPRSPPPQLVGHLCKVLASNGPSLLWANVHNVYFILLCSLNGL